MHRFKIYITIFFVYPLHLIYDTCSRISRVIAAKSFTFLYTRLNRCIFNSITLRYLQSKCQFETIRVYIVILLSSLCRYFSLSRLFSTSTSIVPKVSVINSTPNTSIALRIIYVSLLPFENISSLVLV